MSDETMGDDVYQPDPGADQIDDSGVLDPEDTLLDRGVDEALDEGYSPPERPLGAEHYGITADEQRRGESLDQRLAEEVPDNDPGDGDDLGDSSDTDGELRDGEVGDARSGRLVAPGEGAHDEHDGMVGSDVGIDGSAASAEEAAMHITDDPER
ncbi:DUF5709 domain-containing protein [Streptacidiphilus sp. PAMC 29251]